MTPRSKLFPHQELAVKNLRTGSILHGGVGSGKSLTSIIYYLLNESPKDLYIITTAKKRDSLDWEKECSSQGIYSKLVIDSWNNIAKYASIKNSFFIFDEQRLVGSGAWVKSFLKIAKNNNWILLTATPGDTWMDYIPVFIANGYYKNRTEFIRAHVVYNTFTKYPKVDRYIEEAKLYRLRKQITVEMVYARRTSRHIMNFMVAFDPKKYEIVSESRFNPFSQKPIKDIGDYCYILRKVVNSDASRLDGIRGILQKHRKVIVFYNFDYELEILRKLKDDHELLYAEYNGHRHDPIPVGDYWVYIVQYISGAEGWNCITTDTIAFYSLNYSYRIMEQSMGRIDRINTPYSDLYYYSLRSQSSIDLAISKSLKSKKKFNEKKFYVLKEGQ